MYSRILIANRGEIACRIARTCRGLGIQTIAIYSDADAGARHVREADIAVPIGPAPALQSYLNAGAIVAAALAHGAEAIHPGYGFLSERLELIDACARSGIAFIGPHRDAIARMGSKIESKRIARAAGVHCVPGYDGDDQSLERLVEEAGLIGFPLLIKASAGGGGKGMRRVDAQKEFAERLALARQEALAAFGDDKVLLERFIERPRHLEVQLLGDRHGNIVHLFERECSIQRNYQKVIEEAPAHFLSDAVREKLYASSIALGRAIGYDSAGTVEFVLDADHDDAPYFLEMNTRLQVEHPVTEATTGLDLVELQIRSALGMRLSLSQHDIRREGWAIEARINAEVADEGFRASFGPVTAYAEPADDGVRIDSGIDARSEITPHYDSMLAKVIAFGGTRAVARDRLRAAVARLRIEGVQTNQPLLRDILSHPSFDAVLTTRFLPDMAPGGWMLDPLLAVERKCAAAAAWFVSHLPDRACDRPLSSLAGFRLTARAGRGAQYRLLVGADAERIEVSGPFGAAVRCRLGDTALRFEIVAGPDGRTLLADVRRYSWRLSGEGVGLWCEGDYRDWAVLPEVAARTDGDNRSNNADAMIADMPGVVVELLVAPGDVVVAGAPVAVIEAMKLFHTRTAPRDGTIESILVARGQTVGRGAVLARLTPGQPRGSPWLECISKN